MVAIVVVVARLSAGEKGEARGREWLIRLVEEHPLVARGRECFNRIEQRWVELHVDGLCARLVGVRLLRRRDVRAIVDVSARGPEIVAVLGPEGPPLFVEYSRVVEHLPGISRRLGERTDVQQALEVRVGCERIDELPRIVVDEDRLVVVAVVQQLRIFGGAQDAPPHKVAESARGRDVKRPVVVPAPLRVRAMMMRLIAPAQNPFDLDLGLLPIRAHVVRVVGIEGGTESPPIHRHPGRDESEETAEQSAFDQVGQQIGELFLQCLPFAIELLFQELAKITRSGQRLVHRRVEPIEQRAHDRARERAGLEVVSVSAAAIAPLPRGTELARRRTHIDLRVVRARIESMKGAEQRIVGLLIRLERLVVLLQRSRRSGDDVRLPRSLILRARVLRASSHILPAGDRSCPCRARRSP